MLQLVKPEKKYAESWWQALQEFEAEQVDGFWNIPCRPKSPEEYIQRSEEHSRGKNVPEYWVPSETYWLIDNDIFVGHVNIRYTLNDILKKEGGNIGYAIRPSERRKGYGAEILRRALPKAKEIGLPKVLITCDNTNIASAKIIEKNSGILHDTVETNGKLVRRYWIDEALLS